MTRHNTTSTSPDAPATRNAATTNVSPDEIRKFDALARDWWDSEGPCRPLHRLNPVRANFIDATVAVAGKTLLDIGCGGGLLTEALAQRGAQVTGIDMATESLAVAEHHARESGLNIEYATTTAEDWALSHAGHYDCVTCLEMLEHVPDPNSVISAAAQLVAPGGRVIFSTLNRTPSAFLQAIVGAEYLLQWLPKGTHRYDTFITPAELAQSCRQAGLGVKAIQGVAYNPVTERFSLSHRVSVNYLLVAEKPVSG
jgi:2-polyprenyl-6-hydroxyphenyl methylase / 3-demethylubiquinone-9 3-methyltransferase